MTDRVGPQVHCWEERPGETCLLLDGHDGPHEWTPDADIVVRFEEPERD